VDANEHGVCISDFSITRTLSQEERAITAHE
jgi:hypothetical protein